MGLFHAISNKNSRQDGAVLRHRHWEAFYDEVGIERLQDVLGHKRLVNSGIFVLVQLGQLVLPDVNHVGGEAVSRLILSSLSKTTFSSTSDKEQQEGQEHKTTVEKDIT